MKKKENKKSTKKKQWHTRRKNKRALCQEYWICQMKVQPQQEQDRRKVYKSRGALCFEEGFTRTFPENQM